MNPGTVPVSNATPSALLRAASAGLLGAVALLLAACAGGGPQPLELAAPAPEKRAESFPDSTPGATANPADWHRWRGPELTGISSETHWLTNWPDDGPPRLWKASVGTGFSSVSVSQGKVFTMGHRDGNDVVFCLNATDGEEVWTHSYPAPLHDKYYEGGPSATPTVDGPVVFTLGKSGELFCFETDTGKIVWWKNIAAELGAASPSWGFAGSPLVEGDLLIVNVGAFGTALNKRTGEVVWTTGNDPAGYATPVPFEFDDGSRAIAIFAAESLAAVDINDGTVLWKFPWKTNYDVNAPDPIVNGNEIFVTSGYGTGCALVRFTKNSVEQVWRNKEIRNQVGSCILIDGYIYGVDGQVDSRRPDLKCLEWATGNVAWDASMPGFATLTAAAGKLIVLAENGELMLADASPAGFKLRARAQVTGGVNWTVPVLSNGRIFCRNSRGDLICLDVRLGGPA